MSRLDDFLGLSNADGITKEVDVFLYDDKKKLVKLQVTIQSLSEEKFREIRGRSSISVDKSGTVSEKRSMQLLLCESQIIEPDFANAEFLKKAGCVSARDFIGKKFPPGTIGDIAAAILELSRIIVGNDENEDGEDGDMDIKVSQEMVDEAKN